MFPADRGMSVPRDDITDVKLQHRHRLAASHRRKSFSKFLALLQDELRRRLGFEKGATSPQLRSKGLDDYEQLWKLRGLLHIALHIDDAWELARCTEELMLKTDEEYSRFRYGRIMKKVLWHITKLEGCPLIMDRSSNRELSTGTTMVLSKDGERVQMSRQKFIDSIVCDLEGLYELYEELKQRQQQALLNEVESILTRLKLRPKSLGGVPGGVDDQELVHELTESWEEEEEAKRRVEVRAPENVGELKEANEFEKGLKNERRVSFASTAEPDSPKRMESFE